MGRDLRRDARACLEAAIAAVEPERLVAEDLARRPPPRGRVRLVAIGKAAAAMAAGALRALGDRVRGGVLVVPPGAEPATDPGPGFEVIVGGHPRPDEGSVRGGRAVLELARRTVEDDLLLTLISGGGSALVTLPPADVTLEDLRATTGLLLAAGASIGELNTVRKHLDRLKGGRLAREAAPAPVLALVLSDVVGDPLEVIASGPVTADPTTFEDAVAVLERLAVWERAPEPVRRHLAAGRRGEIEDSPGSGDPCFEAVETRIVGNNLLAAEAALGAAAARGYTTRLLTTELTGEASEAGTRLARVAREVRTGAGPIAPPACLVAAGETTVTVTGAGKGGRNQELALAAALALEGVEGVLVASVGTDGIDGPTDAAGAIAAGDTVTRGQALGLDPEAALDDNDSYPFFAALDDLVFTGPTGTNVMDVQIVLVVKPG